MKSAYNTEWLYNLSIVKETRSWMKSGFISDEQFARISNHYTSSFFHPSFMIRILLFIATLIALAGVTGLLALMFSDVDEDAFPFLFSVYGVVSFVVLDRVFVRRMNHYKSGVNEALIYHATGFIISGVVWFAEASAGISFGFTMLFCALVAYRYHDLVMTAMSFACGCCWLFYGLDASGGVGQQIIPVAFIIVSAVVYFIVKAVQRKENSYLWEDCLTLVEALSLLVIYAAGNYFVVRELSVEMMGLYLEEGQDIPLSVLFYALTVIVPVVYLYFGIIRKDVVLLRVSLVALAFSAFTFKYYFSLGHPAITLTAAGALLIGIALAISRYLKSPRKGFTRELLISEKWADANPEAFVISQTLGGNRVVAADDSFQGGGGDFGGGGASGSF